MIEKIKEFDEFDQNNKKNKEKKSYSEPKLSVMGSMQKVTLGGSQQDGDSGQGTPLQNF